MLGCGQYSVCLESGCTRQWIADTLGKIINRKIHDEAVEKMEETISHLIMKYFNTEFVDLFYNYETMIGHVKSSQEEQSNITGIVMD
mmetsp:Transcript_2442/g.2825  ORF Transcript_2442/g.2825 Transcript_2442/m.2825 type:complete len:87 (-) Transcript_2442:332-592(-)